MTVEAQGAAGGDSGYPGGFGGAVKGVLQVTPGQVLNIYTGGKPTGSSGGFNGGGNGGISFLTTGAGGGGGTDIRIGGTALTDRILVGGGGGGGGGSVNYIPTGGAGGGGTLCMIGSGIGMGGASGSSSCALGTIGGCLGGTAPAYGTSGAGGGISSGGGIAGSGSGANGGAGTLGTGGNGGGYLTGLPPYVSNGGGGGGGGYYGGSGAMSGSGGCNGGGGGGSSFASNLFASVTFTAGVQSGNGFIRVWYEPGNAISVSSTKNPICTGETATLTSSSANVTYTWNTGAQTSSIAVNPTTSTVYSVFGTNSAGCTYSSAISLSVNLSVPVQTITPSSNPVCLGNTLVITSTGGSTYTWTGGINNAVSFTPTTTQSYTVTCANACGNSTAGISITVSPLPVLTNATPTLVCSGQPSTLNANSTATSYSWQPANITTSFSSIVVNPAINTIYTVSATDGTCIGQTTINLNVNPLPAVVASVNSATICQGDSLGLTVSGGLTYTWSVPGQAASYGASVNVSPPATTLVTVLGNNQYGCTATSYIPVYVKASPMSVYAVANKPLVCFGDASTLTATGANTYYWINGSSNYTNIVTPTSTGIYTVIATQTNGCQRTRTVSVSVFHPNPTITPSLTALCKGDYVTLVASPAISYSWNGVSGMSFFGVSPTTNTVYVLTVLASSAAVTCTASATVSITVNENPVVTIVPTKTVLCKNDDPAILVAMGAVTYSWSFIPLSITPSITASVLQTITYSVTGMDSNQCTSSATITIIVNACTGLFENSLTESKIRLYPNPTSGEVRVQFVSTGGNTMIEVFDLTGKTIHCEKIDTVPGENIIQFQLPNEKGVYFVKITNGTEKTLRKILVQ